MKAKLSHKVVLVVSIPLLFQVVFVCIFFNALRELDTIQQAQRQTAKLMLWRNELRVVNTMNGCYYILYRATQKQEYADKLHESIKRNLEILTKFQNEWKHDPVKSDIFAGCIRLHRFVAWQFSQFMHFHDRAFTMTEVFGGPEFVEAAKGEIRQIGNKNLLELYFAELERTRARLNAQFHEKAGELKNILQLSILASIIVSVITGLLFTWSVIRKLQTVAANIRSMESHEELLAPVGGDDEIASLNKSIQETDRLIKQAEEFQAQTARIVANELKEPLDELASTLQTLKEEGFHSITGDGNQRLERSLQEVERLRILTRDLLSLDKISKAGWDLEIGEVNLALIAANAVDTVRDFAAAMSVSIESRLRDTAVSGDAARLQQITLNLLTNAIKFSKRNKTIEIETKTEGNFGKLLVTDHGTGIPEDFQNSVFGKFEQASREDSTEKGGSGLGLAISKKLIEAQQGKMGFQSKLGEGSTFWLTLPLYKETKSDEDKSQNTDANSREDKNSKLEEKNAEDRIPVRPTLWMNGLFLVLLPMLMQLATIGMLWLVINQIGANVSTFYRIGSIAQNHSAVIDAIGLSSRFSMLYNIEKEEVYKRHAQTYQRLLSDLIYESTRMSRGDKTREENAALLDDLANRIIKGENDIMNAPQNAEVGVYFGETRLLDMLDIFGQITAPVEKSVRAADKLIESNTFAKMEMRQNIESILLLSSLLTFICSVVLGMVFTRKLAFRVEHIVQNTKNLIERKPLLHALPGTDEIAFVDRSFYEAGSHLIQLEHFKQEIIAITSHEFRTPLTSLLAKVDLIQVGVFGKLNERGTDLAFKARKNITFLIVLITNLLDVEKIQSGRIIVSKQEVNLDEVFSKARLDVSELAAERAVEISSQAGDITANADAIRLVQAVGAVLRDILEYAPAHSKIDLNAQRRGERIIITIAGPGGNCAEKALKADSARSRLAGDLLRLIIEQHGGSTSTEITNDQLLVSIDIPQV